MVTSGTQVLRNVDPVQLQLTVILMRLLLVVSVQEIRPLHMKEVPALTIAERVCNKHLILTNITTP